MTDKKVRIGDRSFTLPRSRIVRVGAGVLLVFFGFLGFLPVLGFWMIPLGLAVLSVDIPAVRRWRRRLEVWWIEKWRRWRHGTPSRAERRANGNGGGSAEPARDEPRQPGP